MLAICKDRLCSYLSSMLTAMYSVVINVIAGEVVEKVRHTEVFGRLQGIMLAQGLGYLGKSMGSIVLETTN
jgi:hypothetical protein